MDVILHLGAHRTASTSFQHYLRENRVKLEKMDIGYWGPCRIRDGVLAGVVPTAGRLAAPRQYSRACGRIAINLQMAQAQGIQQLVVSDQNLMDAAHRNLRAKRLYGGIGEGVARTVQAFGGRVTRLVLSIRSQENYWASVIASAVWRGERVPDRDDLDRLVTTNRHWRDVITDIACAAPSIDLQVMPFEIYGRRPEARLMQMTGRADVPVHHAREWLCRAPSLSQLRRALKDRGTDPEVLPKGEGQWRPFNTSQTAALREVYADDMYWLRSGADGLARLTDETGSTRTGQQSPVDQMTRGQVDGIEERRMA